MAVIAGLVTDAMGDAVPGARVMVSSSPVPVAALAALTDDGGGFVLGAPAPGAYELTVATDEVVMRATVEVAAGDERADVRVVLTPDA